MTTHAQPVMYAMTSGDDASCSINFVHLCSYLRNFVSYYYTEDTKNHGATQRLK